MSKVQIQVKCDFTGVKDDVAVYVETLTGRERFSLGFQDLLGSHGGTMRQGIRVYVVQYHFHQQQQFRFVMFVGQEPVGEVTVRLSEMVAAFELKRALVPCATLAGPAPKEIGMLITTTSEADAAHVLTPCTPVTYGKVGRGRGGLVKQIADTIHAEQDGGPLDPVDKRRRKALNPMFEAKPGENALLPVGRRGAPGHGTPDEEESGNSDDEGADQAKFVSDPVNAGVAEPAVDHAPAPAEPPASPVVPAAGAAPAADPDAAAPAADPDAAAPAADPDAAAPAADPVASVANAPPAFAADAAAPAAEPAAAEPPAAASPLSGAPLIGKPADISSPAAANNPFDMMDAALAPTPTTPAAANNPFGDSDVGAGTATNNPFGNTPSNNPFESDLFGTYDPFVQPDASPFDDPYFDAPTHPLPEGWAEFYTFDGRPYYLNQATGASQWERPEVPPPAAASPVPASEPFPPASAPAPGMHADELEMLGAPSRPPPSSPASLPPPSPAASQDAALDVIANPFDFASAEVYESNAGSDAVGPAQITFAMTDGDSSDDDLGTPTSAPPATVSVCIRVNGANGFDNVAKHNVLHSTPSAYVIVAVNGVELFRTKKASATRTPKWNDERVALLDGLGLNEVTFTVMDHHNFHRDKVLGSVQLDVGFTDLSWAPRGLMVLDGNGIEICCLDVALARVDGMSDFQDPKKGKTMAKQRAKDAKVAAKARKKALKRAEEDRKTACARESNKTLIRAESFIEGGALAPGRPERDVVGENAPQRAAPVLLDVKDPSTFTIPVRPITPPGNDPDRTTYRDFRNPYSLVNYITGGVKFSLTVAIDFTVSNGNPTSPNSLHYMNPAAPPNEYVQAIQAVGYILGDYASSTDNFPVYGFGGEPLDGYSGHRASDGNVSHCFAVNGDMGNPGCGGVQGVLSAYQQCLSHVRLSAPTNFARVIQRAYDAAYDSDDQSYHVLLLITDGEITQGPGVNFLTETIDTLVAASHVPLSVVIVGVGNESFENMQLLGAPDAPLLSSRGEIAERDVAKFVPFSQFKHDPHALSREVLQNLPSQFLQYAAKENIHPGNISGHRPARIAKHPRHTAAVPGVRSPSVHVPVEFVDAIASMEVMGFSDIEANLACLRQHNGNVEAAINALVE